MASLFMTQVIGTIKKINGQSYVSWDNADTISNLNLITFKKVSNSTNLIINDSQTEKCIINYISVQGVPGLKILLNDSINYQIGHTGIAEFSIYNNNPITSLVIEGTSLLNAMQQKDLDYYSYNTKCIVDIVYKIKE